MQTRGKCSNIFKGWNDKTVYPENTLQKQRWNQDFTDKKKKKVEKISSKSILQEMKRISSGKGKIIPDTNSHLLKGIEFQKWG